MGIEIEGLEALLDKLDGMSDPAVIAPAMKKACLVVERSAKMKAPKGNGELGRSITSEVEVVPGEVRGIVYTPLEYAPYVEFGTGLFAEEGNGRKDVPWHYQDDEGEWHTTSGQHPKPFLRPALYENRTEILRILEGAHND